jgi:hypothetical protein
MVGTKVWLRRQDEQSCSFVMGMISLAFLRTRQRADSEVLRSRHFPYIFLTYQLLTGLNDAC